MSNAAHLLDNERLTAAATAIANAWATRHGAGALDDILDRLPERVFEQVVEDARAAITALDAIPPKPRARGPLNAADVEALRLDVGAGTLLVIGRDFQSLAFGALSAAAVGGALMSPDVAEILWDAFTDQSRKAASREAAEATPPASPAPQDP